MTNTKSYAEQKQWNDVVKAIKKKYPNLSEKAVYVRAKYVCEKNPVKTPVKKNTYVKRETKATLPENTKMVLSTELKKGDRILVEYGTDFLEVIFEAATEQQEKNGRWITVTGTYVTSGRTYSGAFYRENNQTLSIPYAA